MAKHVPSSGDVKNSFINRIDFSKKLTHVTKEQSSSQKLNILILISLQPDFVDL